ncbi:NAD(P)H-dependent flavin oxidoreductase [Falsigemmobacter faecalis]|uniref:Nitronate monooxygenase n=1 Tax=Falsigemmobacter faecalis TaxID=2488730 RepID=A0A3P3DTT8_9RHOB|nr:nitronate monooxygenase [Falsigemmobacter faecalis]RRH76882.1 nitronate monooxygenase [Falsigemmobacter faecalis]
MGLETRFTRAFGLRHPIALAPMAGVAGGQLAGAVAAAGGLGLLGGGYGDSTWIGEQIPLAAGNPVGIGFITWKLTEPLLEEALERQPKAVMLSFGGLQPFAARIRAAGVPLIAQVQDMNAARAAVEAGADVIVAQGAEAGGHGAGRATFTLVPEVADYLAVHAPGCILLAAGGIADGRGLAAALMLGAEGALIGSRFWAAQEALVPAGFQDAALAATGDQTLRGSVPDAARMLHWPAPYTIRTLQSEFTDRWQSNTEALRDPAQAPARLAWAAAQSRGDARSGTPVVGEAVGLIGDIRPAAEILDRITTEALSRLNAQRRG